MAAVTFTHALPDDTVEKRTSKTMDYTHVVVGRLAARHGLPEHWGVFRWSQSEAGARKHAAAIQRGAWCREVRVEAINGGER